MIPLFRASEERGVSRANEALKIAALARDKIAEPRSRAKTLPGLRAALSERQKPADLIKNKWAKQISSENLRRTDKGPEAPAGPARSKTHDWA